MNFSWIIPDKLAGSMGPVIPEELLYLKEQGIGALVRMERNTISGEGAGLNDFAEYVEDTQPPTFSQVDRIIAFIQEQIDGEAPVAVSCKAGVGRAGTVLACYLVHTGYSATDAVAHVRGVRPGSVENPIQLSFVYSYQDRLRRGAE